MKAQIFFYVSIGIALSNEECAAFRVWQRKTAGFPQETRQARRCDGMRSIPSLAA